MSTVKAIRLQLGQSGTATQNFTLTAEAADGTMKLARGVAGGTTQDILTINALGEVDFPQMIRLYSANGYQKLPGGLILQWGTLNIGTSATTVTFPTAFPTFCASITLGMAATGQPATQYCSVTTRTTTTFNVVANAGSPATFWIAIGY